MNKAADAVVSFGAIVLAAGGSTRLGQPKQLVKLGEETLLASTTRMALEAGASPLIVVLGYKSARMERELEGRCVTVAHNPDWETGMASSLRIGVQTLLSTRPDCESVLLLVCDQAHLSTRVLRDLIRVHTDTKHPLTAARYGAQLGVPAIFRRALFDELLSLEGDQGGRSILAKYSANAGVIEFPDGAVDVDVPEDLATLQRH